MDKLFQDLMQNPSLFASLELERGWIFVLMASTICMNNKCSSTSTREWKKGWPLRSGGLAVLCNKCGSAYDNSIFCDIFHLEETGWRECRFCGKHIHCGCIASSSLFEPLDFGGISCNSCVNAPPLHMIQNNEIPNGFFTSAKNYATNSQSTAIDGRLFADGFDKGIMQLCRVMEADESIHQLQSQREKINLSSDLMNQQIPYKTKEADAAFSNVAQPSIQSLVFTKLDNTRLIFEKGRHESPAYPSLNMTLGAASGTSMLSLTGGTIEGEDQGKVSLTCYQGERSHPILPKPLKPGLAMNLESNKGMTSEKRIARPPAEGRGKNQLLPRYWPRITDQELEQLSGDLKSEGSNSKIVPLFEKVLSASDAGRIGRLVLPKACAEAYLPPIHQSEGIALKMQDVKKNEWTFQFRFWPNNNSRMYVLEGVTPCIQAMDLRAGDTVTFSRIDPEGKLIIGCRKALDSADTQDTPTAGLSSSRETALSGARLAEHLQMGNGDIALCRSEHHGGKRSNDLLQEPIPLSEKKKTRNIGPKSKRLLIHSEDALELRLTWEEAQDLLRPPPCVKPTIVTIEDHTFEEYDEPPVFGKKTIFTEQSSGTQVQWTQCDDCFKWRRLPVDVLLPPKWTCSENVWDVSRSLCTISEELNPKELENLFRMSNDSKKWKVGENSKSVQEHEPSGLDALASAAVLGDTLGDLGETSPGATTKHPRHRPGCTCIVCIQPPSGKGKHKPTCTCNVCLTVKRRFKTLMLRKKKRQSERELDPARKGNDLHKDKSEAQAEATLKDASLLASLLENDGSPRNTRIEFSENIAGPIDLNCDPDREDMKPEIPMLSTINDVEITSHLMENCMKRDQNGWKNVLVTYEQPANEVSLLPRHASEEGQRQEVEETYLEDEVHCESKSDRNNLS